MLVDVDIIARIFIKKTVYQMFINRWRTTTTQGSSQRLPKLGFEVNQPSKILIKILSVT